MRRRWSLSNNIDIMQNSSFSSYQCAPALSFVSSSKVWLIMSAAVVELSEESLLCFSSLENLRGSSCWHERGWCFNVPSTAPTPDDECEGVDGTSFMGFSR